MSEERKWKVYCHTHKDSGKRYYGITCRRLSARFVNGKGYGGCRYFDHAIQKYGWDSFSHELVADRLSLEEANALERYYIAKYRTNDRRFGYNIQKGGLSGGGMSPEGRASTALAHSGKNSFKARGVILFGAGGKRIGEFDTLAEAATYAHLPKSTANHSSLCKSVTRSGFLFLYKEDCEWDCDIPTDLYESFALYKKSLSNLYRRSITPVLAYGRDGTLIRRYEKIEDAANDYGVSPSCIYRSMKSLRLTYLGVFFRSVDLFDGVSHLSSTDIRENLFDARGCKGVSVFSFSNGKKVKDFDSVLEAERFVGTSIHDVLNHKDNRVKEYVCRYSEEVVDIDRLSVGEYGKKRNHFQKPIVQFDMNGNVIAEYESTKSASDQTGISFKAISLCANGKTKTSGGFVWRFAQDLMEDSGRAG